jgi:microcystin-dependent protein
MSEPFIGEIIMFGGNFAPRGWAMCNGQLLSISQNTALFSILGTSFGGNGTTTFGLPDLRSRVPIHQGQGPGLSPYVLGQQGGPENVTLLQNNMPIHTHLANASTINADQPSPAGAIWASPVDSQGGAGTGYTKQAANTTMAPNAIGNAGGSVPFSIVQPYLAVTFIIALQGIFPSRN